MKIINANTDIMKTSKKQFRMKSIITTLVMTLCIFSTSTFAHEYKKMESKPTEKVISSNFDFFIHYLSNDNFEESLPVKSWMLCSESFVEIEINSIPNDNEEVALTLESWMMDVQAFIPEEDEPESVIENWMLDVDSFIGNNLNTSNFALK